jgi:hypothetical protein
MDLTCPIFRWSVERSGRRKLRASGGAAPAACG